MGNYGDYNITSYNNKFPIWNWNYGAGDKNSTVNKVEIPVEESTTTGNVNFNGSITPVETPKTAGTTETSWVQKAFAAVSRVKDDAHPKYENGYSGPNGPQYNNTHNVSGKLYDILA